jgi:uroporphyrin-III C-methyltransferase
LGAAAAAGISLTDRRAASQIVITTYSRGSDAAVSDPFAATPQLNWAAISSSTTLVLYMPGADYAEVSQRLLDAGQPKDLPCVIVSNATGPLQQIRWSSVAGLSREAKLPAPALLIVGRVATHEIREIAANHWSGTRREHPIRNATII